MKTKAFLALLFLITFFNLANANTDSIGKATIYGNIIFEEIEGEDYGPRSIILKQTWPIVADMYKQYEFDSLDYSFSFELNLTELTHYTLFLSFEPDVSLTITNEHYLTPSDSPRYLKNSNNKPIDTLNNGELKFSLLEIGDFIAEEGDSLRIAFDYANTTNFKELLIKISGEGKCNNNFMPYWSKLNKEYFYYSEGKRKPEGSFEKKLEYLDSAYAELHQILNEARDSISDSYYEITKMNLKYSRLPAHQGRLSMYFKNTIQYRKKSRELLEFMDTITIKETYLKSKEFRRFLSDYLFTLHPNKKHSSNFPNGGSGSFSYGDDYNSSYHMAKAVYSGKVLKYILYAKLKSGFRFSRTFELAVPHYHNFIELYPDSEEAKILTKIYDNYSNAIVGEKAPNLTLINKDGKKVNLHELRGSIIYMPRHILTDSARLSYLTKLKRKFPNNELVIISTSNPLEVSNKNWEIFNYYIHPDFVNELAPYRFHIPFNQIIVDKSGVIRKHGWSIGNREQLINELLEEPYHKQSKLSKFAKENSNLLLFFLGFILSLSIVLIINYTIKIRKQKNLKLISESELKAIRSQLNPHFLFNSLNSIQNFINSSSAEKANTHLSQFSRLMRQTLELSNQNSITLHDEISFIKDYIELEQVRYDFKLSFEVDENIDLYNVEIPSLITQPFVENAIVHGMAELGEKGKLMIKVSQRENYLIFEITDNGKGLPENNNEGFGLNACKDRINLVNSQNKHKIELAIESPIFENKYGTKITLSIPEYY